MKKILTLLATIAFLATFTSSHAAGYIGISFGSTSPDEDGFDDSNGYKLTAGYNANENVSLEASFTNLGEFDADDDLIAVLEFFSGFAIDDASIEVDGIEFAVLGHAPLSDTASIFGRVGIFMWDADFKIDTVSFGSDSETDDGSDVFFGAGLSFDVGSQAALKVEYTMYDAADGDIDFLGAGLDIRF
jgi:opacity protein-like surface antigen